MAFNVPRGIVPPHGFQVVVPVSSTVDAPCVRVKLDDASIAEALLPTTDALLDQPYDAARVARAIRDGLVVALDHPESVYRVVEGGHIYAYPRDGEPAQYVAWQYGTWTWQDVPDGDLQHLRLVVNGDDPRDRLARPYPATPIPAISDLAGNYEYAAIAAAHTPDELADFHAWMYGQTLVVGDRGQTVVMARDYERWWERRQATLEQSNTRR